MDTGQGVARRHVLRVTSHRLLGARQRGSQFLARGSETGIQQAACATGSYRRADHQFCQWRYAGNASCRRLQRDDRSNARAHSYTPHDTSAANQYIYVFHATDKHLKPHDIRDGFL